MFNVMLVRWCLFSGGVLAGNVTKETLGSNNTKDILKVHTEQINHSWLINCLSIPQSILNK